MKNIQLFVVAAISAAALFFATSAGAQDAKQGVATIVRIHGSATFTTGDGNWQPLYVGTILGASAVIKTAPDSTVDIVLSEKKIFVPIVSTPQNRPVGANPLQYSAASQQNTIRMAGDTVLAIDKLNISDTGAGTVSDTELDLRSGKVFGNVKKLSAMSTYEIKTPTGVAGIRGTSFSLGGDGSVIVFSGSVVVSYTVGTTTYTQEVAPGYEFIPSANGGPGTLSYIVPEGQTLDQWSQSQAAANGPGLSTAQQTTISFQNNTTTTEYVSPTP